MRTIGQIKAAMVARGSHWWDVGTFEHWGTVVYPKVYTAGKDAGQFFITSEYDENDDPAPLFTVRRYDPATVTIEYAPGHTFKEFATHDEAEAAAVRAMKAEISVLARAARESKKSKS